MNLHLITGRSGKEHVTAADHGAFHVATLIDGNVVFNCGNTFAANIISNNLIKILDGELMMQGRHIRLESGSYIEVPIENGAQDYKRNDLIVIKYTKDATTDTESVCVEVIKGTATTGTAVDPEYTPGNILDGDLTAIFPLYRISIDGLNVQEPEALFEIVGNFDERLKALANEKSNKVHKHTVSEISDFPESMTPTAHKHTKSEITDFPSSMTPTAHKHTVSEITDFPSTMAPSSHKQAASTITAGTFDGQVKAPAGTDYTTARMRNVVVVAKANSPVDGGASSYPNGTITFVRKS